MQNRSWEIIIAGVVLLFAAVYITSSDSDQESNTYEYNVAVETDAYAETSSSTSSVRVIDLKGLAKLEELKVLEEKVHLESLAGLERLSGLFPQEARDELNAEINKVIRDLEGDSTSISIDFSDGMLVINRNFENLKPGSWSATSPGVFAYMQEFEVPNLKKTTISIPSGSIDIVGTNEPKAKLLVHASGKIASKEALANYFNTRAVVEDDEAIFTFESAIDEAQNNIQLQATLQIPVNTDIYSMTKAGHIMATNISGDQTYKTLGGHLELKNLSGDITAFTEGGHIEVKNINGDLIMESLGGHLVVSDSEGDITLKTSGGDIQALNTKGDLSATTGGGNVTLRVKEITGKVTASTGAGTLLLWLPENANLDLRAEATSFKIEDLFNFQGTKDKRKVEGSLGSGGPEYQLKTSYGSLSVRKNE